MINYEGYSGYTLTKCYFSRSFYSMIKDFSLSESDIGIDIEDFPRLFNMDRNYFNSNTLYIIFPLFIKKLSPTNGYSNEYYIDNSLFHDLKIRLYTDKKNLNFIETKRNNTNNSTILRIPLIPKEKNVNFELYHYKFGKIIKEKLDNEKHYDNYNDTIINIPKEGNINRLSINDKKEINIFLNYARENLMQAQKLYDILSKNYSVWFDKKSLHGGQEWELEIEKAIKASDYVIILFSSTSINKRGTVQKEYKLALDVMKTIPYDQIFIIPVRIDDCEVPTQFQRYHYIDLFPYWDQGIRKILQSINLDKKSSKQN